MSDTPFSDFSNATFFLEELATASDIDPVTKNRVFSAGERFEVSAMLLARSSARVERLPGVDANAVFLSGRICKVVKTSEPLLNLPLSIPFNVTAKTVDCIYNSENGKLTFYRTSKSPFGISEALGDRIEGWFSYDK